MRIADVVIISQMVPPLLCRCIFGENGTFKQKLYARGGPLIQDSVRAGRRIVARLAYIGEGRISQYGY